MGLLTYLLLFQHLPFYWAGNFLFLPNHGHSPALHDPETHLCYLAAVMLFIPKLLERSLRYLSLSLHLKLISPRTALCPLLPCAPETAQPGWTGRCVLQTSVTVSGRGAHLRRIRHFLPWPPPEGRPAGVHATVFCFPPHCPLLMTPSPLRGSRCSSEFEARCCTSSSLYAQPHPSQECKCRLCDDDLHVPVFMQRSSSVYRSSCRVLALLLIKYTFSTFLAFKTQLFFL